MTAMIAQGLFRPGRGRYHAGREGSGSMRRLLLIVLGLALVVVLAAAALAAVIVAREGPEGLGDAVNALALFLQGDHEEASGPVTAPGLEAETGARVFSIVQEESEVRFLIDEVLRGADFTVVGVTNQVAGDISVNAARPAESGIGLIRINARTLATGQRQSQPRAAHLHPENPPRMNSSSPSLKRRNLRACRRVWRSARPSSFRSWGNCASPAPRRR